MKKKILLIGVLMLQTAIYSAMASDFAYIEYQYIPESSTEASLHGEPEDITTSQHSIKTQFGIPLYAPEGADPFYAGLNFSYSQKNTYIDYEDGGDSTEERLHALSSAMNVYVPVENNLGISFALGGSLNTNFDNTKEIDQRDFVTNGSLVFIKSGGNTTYTYGLSSVSSFGKPMILPILGFSIKPQPWFEFSILAPSEIATYAYYQKTTFGIFTRLTGDEYRLSHNDDSNNYTLSFSALETGVSLRYGVWNHIYLYSESGVYPYRVETVNRPDGSNYTNTSYGDNLIKGGFIRIGVAFNAH